MAVLHLAPGQYAPCEAMQQKDLVECEYVDPFLCRSVVGCCKVQGNRQKTEMQLWSRLALSSSPWLMIGHARLVVRP
jgi:hypothetical protein